MSEVITGFYDNRADALAAIEKLVTAGIDRDQITLNPRSESADYVRDEEAASYDHYRDEGGFWAMLKDFFFPEERRYAYSEGMSRGGTLLAVRAEENQVETVGRILDDHGSVDLAGRAETWRESGWQGYRAADAAGTAASAAETSRLYGDVGPKPTDQAGDEQIHEDMEVISADGVRMGTVDRVVGDGQIKLARNTSPDGLHHFVPLDWVDHVDAHVHLKRNAPEVEAIW